MIRATVIKDVRDHMPSRAPEWWAALTMLVLGAWLARPIESLSLSPSYALMAEFAPEPEWAKFLVELAVVRLAALFLNGTFKSTRRWSPLVRSIASVASAMVWGLVCAMTWSASAGALITPVSGMIAVGEMALGIVIARRAGRAVKEFR